MSEATAAVGRTDCMCAVILSKACIDASSNSVSGRVGSSGFSSRSSRIAAGVSSPCQPQQRRSTYGGEYDDLSRGVLDMPVSNSG